MKTNQLINNFLLGDTSGKASNMHIEGDKLFNWDTVIAQRINGVIHINDTHYSPTTSKHQNIFKRQCPNAPTTTKKVPMGAHDLKRYL